MRILFVTSRFPYPPLRGDQAIPYHRLRILSRTHEITLLSFYQSESELQGLNNLKPFCKHIHTIRLPLWRSVFNVGLNGLFSQLPLQVLYYRSSEFKKLLGQLLKKNEYDLVHAYLLRIGPYLSEVPIPKVLELIDSMQLNWARRVEAESLPGKWFYAEELRRVRNYERTIGNHFDRMLVVSKQDREFIPTSNVEVVPLGVDTDFFKPSARKAGAHNIVFSGNMGYSPNIQAVKWFVDKCLPGIQRAVPDSTFTVLGINPPREIRSLSGRKGVSVTGFVDSIPEALGNASVAVAPMLSGSGMQFKILEAMACGLPVVATSLGLGDIKAVPGRDIAVADSPEQFTKSVVSLLAAPRVAEEMGTAGRSFVISNHSWETLSAKVDAIYRALAKK